MSSIYLSCTINDLIVLSFHVQWVEELYYQSSLYSLAILYTLYIYSMSGVVKTKMQLS